MAYNFVRNSISSQYSNWRPMSFWLSASVAVICEHCMSVAMVTDIGLTLMLQLLLSESIACQFKQTSKSLVSMKL